MFAVRDGAGAALVEIATPPFLANEFSRPRAASPAKVMRGRRYGKPAPARGGKAPRNRAGEGLRCRR